MNRFALFDTYRSVVEDSKDVSEYVAESIRNIYGVIVNVNLALHDGLTAKETAKRVLTEYGMPEVEIDEKLDRYLEDLPYSYYNVAWSDRINVAEGVGDLLEELGRKEIIAGIATGEEERVAKMRLEKVKLDRYFKFGSFAENGESISEIINSAIDLVSSRFGMGKENGFFFAGSPGSALAGKKAGIYTIGIGSYRYGEKELSAAGADITFGSFKEKGKILRLLKA